MFLNNKDELCSALNVLSDFGNVAGTVLNAGKCEGMWLGNVDTRHIRNDLFVIKWKSSMRCLGIYFGKDHHTNYKKKWSEKLESIESCLLKLEKRDLTLFGKVQVMKILALPKIILSATILHVPQDVISELTKMFFNSCGGKLIE